VKRKYTRFVISLLVLLFGLTILETQVDRLFFIYYYSDNKETAISQFILNLFLNMIIMSLALGYGFTKNWMKNEEMKQILMREKLTAELSLLRAQLNPHFLFNVLNMAYSSSCSFGDNTTADIIEKISGLMRYTTYESNVDRIGLNREIEYLQNYIALQKMRFSEDLPVKVNFNIEGNIDGLQISPLILIQFVENAFKHGVKLGRGSEINIEIVTSGKDLEFSTRNPVFGTGGNKGGIGITNVKKRLSILYPRKHNLSIENDGSVFSVSLQMNLD
jgi:LytS/YehU family sensor histidine kinase